MFVEGEKRFRRMANQFVFFFFLFHGFADVQDRGCGLSGTVSFE